MPDRALYQVSASKIQTWLDCPRKFWFGYVERVRVKSSWAHLTMGNALHAALRDWWDVPSPARSPQVAQRLLAGHWSAEGFRNHGQAEQWERSAAMMLCGYLSRLDPAFEPMSCERTLSFRTDHLAVTARIDRIDRINRFNRMDQPEEHSDGEGLVIVDYKTGKRVPQQDEVRGSVALALYAICVQQALRRPCSRVELHHVPSATVAGWDHSDQALRRHLGRVEDIAEEMRAAEARAVPGGVEQQVAFEPRPGPLCGWCDYRGLCREGADAAPAQPSWAGLPEAPEDAESIPELALGQGL